MKKFIVGILIGLFCLSIIEIICNLLEIIKIKIVKKILVEKATIIELQNDENDNRIFPMGFQIPDSDNETEDEEED